MERFFDSHWALRISALILAFALFFYVQSIDSDGKETSSSLETDVITGVPLEVYYDEDNLIVTGLPETVDIQIEGPMQVVAQAKLLKDFKAFVNLDTLLIGEHSVPIETEGFSDKLNVTIDPATVKIQIEERISQEFRVEPDINKRLLADGFVLDTMEATPARVLITGAKSIIDSISYVKATVKSDGNISESFSVKSNVIVLNKDLNKLEVIIDPSAVEVKVNVKPYTKEVPLSLKTVGAAEDVEVNNLELLTKEVTITGTKTLIDSINEIVAEISLDTVKNSGNYEVRLQLPEGVKVTSETPVLVKADVTVTSSSVEDAIEDDGTRD